MDIIMKQLHDVDIIDDQLKVRGEVSIVFHEYDGSFCGGKTEIKMPAKSYEMLEETIVEKWLEKKKSSISD